MKSGFQRKDGQKCFILCFLLRYGINTSNRKARTNNNPGIYSGVNPINLSEHLKMKIAIIGTRGIPARYGGFETFAEELSVRLAKKGTDITVFCDRREEQEPDYKGVKLQYIDCLKSDNPLLYYFKSILKAGKANNILIICGSPGALFLFNRVFTKRTKYIINVDGIEHFRSKWSFLHRLLLLFSERCAVKYSDYIIADSAGIKKYLSESYRIRPEKLVQIEYGAYNISHACQDLIEEYNLEPFKYYLVVSRLEPENNIEMILKGYQKSGTDMPLLIVGGFRNKKYVECLKKMNIKNTLFANGIYDKEKLKALRFYCKAYLHGHSVGGTNPSLLEALGCGNIVIAHDNVFNREVTESKMFYFNDTEECAAAIKKTCELDHEEEKNLKLYSQARIRDYYNWDRIADVYNLFLNKILEE
jgi:glycosyltransferase involved in cell wall biosynthesis